MKSFFAECKEERVNKKWGTFTLKNLLMSIFLLVANCLLRIICGFMGYNFKIFFKMKSFLTFKKCLLDNSKSSCEYIIFKKNVGETEARDLDNQETDPSHYCLLFLALFIVSFFFTKNVIFSKFQF
jgi:hypothetical protein